MSLKLTRLDDPLSAAPVALPVQPPPEPAAEPQRETKPAAGRGRKPRAKAPSQRQDQSAARGEGPYDSDRLEQTGWRFYESVKAQVHEAAEELSAAGTPASEVALAQAVVALRMPDSLEERKALMEEWRQLTATRGRRSA